MPKSDISELLTTLTCLSKSYIFLLLLIGPIVQCCNYGVIFVTMILLIYFLVDLITLAILTLGQIIHCKHVYNIKIIGLIKILNEIFLSVSVDHIFVPCRNILCQKLGVTNTLHPGKFIIN